MKSDYLSNKIGRILLALFFLAGIGIASSTAAQAQRSADRDQARNQDRQDRRAQNRSDRDRNRRDRTYNRNRDNSVSRDNSVNRDNSRNRDYRSGRNVGVYGNGGYGNGGYGNNGGYGGYGNSNQVAISQGYQDGLYTGSSDAQRGQNYNPQRSHFYRNGHGDSGGYYGNGNPQAYRDGFLRGYDEGFRRNGGYNRNRRSNGNSGRFPFPW